MLAFYINTSDRLTICKIISVSKEDWRLLHALYMTLRIAPLLSPFLKLPAIDAHNCNTDLVRHNQSIFKENGALQHAC